MNGFNAVVSKSAPSVHTAPLVKSNPVPGPLVKTIYPGPVVPAPILSRPVVKTVLPSPLVKAVVGPVGLKGIQQVYASPLGM